jgi:hypothetical protein
VKAGVQSALYCRCGNEKILRPRPLCHLHPLKQQDEGYFGGRMRNTSADCAKRFYNVMAIVRRMRSLGTPQAVNCRPSSLE